MSNPLVALEVGTHTVRALIAEFFENGDIEVLGYGACESLGIEKSEVVDPAAAQTCVQSAFARAEHMAGMVVDHCHLAYSCGSIEAVLQHASVPVLSGTITEDTVEDVKENARAISIPVDREILHSVPQHFYVDSQPGVVNPIGMVGSRLELDMLLLHGETTRMQNMVKVVNEARATVDSAAFSGLCAGLSILTDEQRKRGALVIDFGGGTTDFVAYAGGVPSFAGSIPVGGRHVTRDIAAGLNLPFEDAEHLKVTYASCNVDLAERGAAVTLDDESVVPRRVSLRDLNLIVNARVEETLQIIHQRLQQQMPHLSAGVVLTGGGSQQKDIVELANRVFKTRCQLADPYGLTGERAPAPEEHWEYAALAGILRNVRRERGRRERQGAGGFWPFRRR